MPELNTDTPTRLDVDSASKAFEGFLSSDEEYREPEQKGKKAKPESEPEPEVEEGEPEEPAEEPTDDAQDEDEQPGDDEGESEGESEDTDEEPDAPQMVTITIDGKAVQVPLDEALKGYSRTQDYTRKTQKLAEERKTFQAEKDAVARERQEYATYLSQLKTALEQSSQEPDWDKLRAEDPDAFPTAYAEWHRHKERLQKIEKEQQETMAKVARDHAERFNAYVAEQKTKLLEILPTWSNPEVAKQESKELREFAQSLGFTDDEVNQVYDHRLIALLRDASAYRKALQKQETVKAKVVKAVVEKPGQRKPKRKMPEAVKAQLLARKTGRVDHAAKAFELMLGDDD